jgi:hypothetical protein
MAWSVHGQLTHVERSKGKDSWAVSAILCDQALLACEKLLSFLVDTSSGLPAAVKGAPLLRGEANPCTARATRKSLLGKERSGHRSLRFTH